MKLARNKILTPFWAAVFSTSLGVPLVEIASRHAAKNEAEHSRIAMSAYLWQSEETEMRPGASGTIEEIIIEVSRKCEILGILPDDYGKIISLFASPSDIINAKISINPQKGADVKAIFNELKAALEFGVVGRNIVCPWATVIIDKLEIKDDTIFFSYRQAVMAVSSH